MLTSLRTRCFTSRPMDKSRVLRLCPIICAAAIAFASLTPAFGLEADRSLRGLTQEQIEEFTKRGVPDAEYPRLLELLGREDESNAIRALIKDQKPFPATTLVDQLISKRLAVRLGALDLLEDAAGETFGFDPWLEDPASGGNVESISRWKTWLEKG